MVTVPYGVYYAPISVYTNGLYAVSNQHFNAIFDATEELKTSHLSNQLDNPFLGAKYYDVKIADLNGDGIPEIVTSEAGSSSSAYLAIFTTSFDDEGMISIDDRLEINFGTGVYSAPHDIALGDLNGDGLLDVVVSEKGDITDDFQAHTCIFINTSHHQNFSFDSPIIIEGDGYEAYAQLQDINGDGKLDIVTIRGSSWHTMNVYINTSDGNNVSFEDKLIISNVLASELDFADLNGDGMIDMVTTAYASSSYSREVFVYLNNSTEGNIEFNLEVTILSGGEHADWPTDYNWSTGSPTLVDIDGDGRLDIIVANGTCVGCSPSGISILRNTSTESELLFEYEYSDFYQYQSNSLPVGIGISDLNGDGKPDLLTNDWMGGI
ncbi:MAG: VCBS repeat-containing protein, partial [Candidatus Neomarinimicrobiota bacterium]|nr:VCBS repeat-containing protein [Candidatus Neomarinimicrobiota bacterium]